MNLLKRLEVYLWAFSSRFSQPIFSEAPLSTNLIPPLILHHLLGFSGVGRPFLNGNLYSHILTMNISLLWKDFIFISISFLLVMFLWNKKCLLLLVMSEVMILEYSNSYIYQWQRGRSTFSCGAKIMSQLTKEQVSNLPHPLWHLSHECPSIHASSYFAPHQIHSLIRTSCEDCVRVIFWSKEWEGKRKKDTLME